MDWSGQSEWLNAPCGLWKVNLTEINPLFVAVGGGSSQGWETMSVAAVSMFAGFIVGVLLGSRRSCGYQRVPNAAGPLQE